MSGSTFGKCFQVSTWGESHGPALGVVIQGCPPGIELDESVIQKSLDKRKPGHGVASTKRKEPDIPEIMSGIFEGKTTGTPISIMIRNHDAKSRDYSDIASLFRPGHGDFTYHAKYGIRDYRGGGRASARETAARVAAGAVAEAFLRQIGHNISVDSMTVALGGIWIEKKDFAFAASNSFECPDQNALGKIEKRIDEVRKSGDSLGGVLEITARNVPAGLGEPVFDKLDADIAKAMMSIGAVKAVEIGSGCEAAVKTGFDNNDQITPSGFESNNCGGILAGISNGDDIVVRVHVKPIPSILKEQKTVDDKGNPCVLSTRGRHDICAIPRINPVCRAMLYLVIADHVLRQKAISPQKS
ncbi:Chorismate synthase [Desulfamplus magnetovallimortis]|uniref:Chorismate synthase n=1 Tax=Desulfamplus magnetovallimortis TaxID=1246637 RepID=A0A1W1H4U6_9BACT|nr:chorismate synthase [Desulfamplus magnetovallimortis]SLM27476.1 Chorismate synthase [Desulfamplus magnetovallimortis]